MSVCEASGPFVDGWLGQVVRCVAGVLVDKLIDVNISVAGFVVEVDVDGGVGLKARNDLLHGNDATTLRGAGFGVEEGAHRANAV